MSKLKYKYALIFIILLTLVSCSVNSEPNTNKSISEGTPKKTRTMETEKYIVEKVEFDIPKFEPIDVRGFDDENLIVIMDNYTYHRLQEKPSSDVVERIYAYNLLSKQHSLIYEGNYVYGEEWKLKKLLDGNFLLEGANRALEIEKESFKLKRIVPYPEGSYQGCSSHSQTQIVCNKEEGIYLHTLNSSTNRTIELFKFDEKEQIRPTDPCWSYDDKQIGYILFNRQDTDLNEVVIVDTINKKQKSYVVSGAATGWWFQDNKRFLTYYYMPGEHPIIKIIDTSDDQIKEYEKTGGMEIECPPHGDQVLYMNTDTEAKSKYLPKKIVNFNVATNTSELVTPDFLNIKSCDFSPSGNMILFVANSNPEEKLSIYIAKKKIQR